MSARSVRWSARSASSVWRAAVSALSLADLANRAERYVSSQVAKGNSRNISLVSNRAERRQGDAGGNRSEEAQGPVREVSWSESSAQVIERVVPPRLLRLIFSCGCIWAGGRLAWLTGCVRRYRRARWRILSIA